MKKILIVVGTRPNLIKAAPIIRTLRKRNFPFKIVHTGQHYDKNMSDYFFEELGIPRPEINLFAGRSLSEIKQISTIMDRFEDVCISERPDIVIVIGDVNSTLACALVASRLKGVKLVHVEAGERSFDLDMPEEMNRILTDRLSDIKFCSSSKSLENLGKESRANSYVVGNITLDNLYYFKRTIRMLPHRNNFILCTIHRQSNTDIENNLSNIITALNTISSEIEIVFPLHPRTKKQIEFFSLGKYLDKRISICDPLGFKDFITYLDNAKMVITDSGGVQVEAYELETPCVTLRKSTEWTETLYDGANVLVDPSSSSIEIVEKVYECLERKKITFHKNRKNVSENIIDILMR